MSLRVDGIARQWYKFVFGSVVSGRLCAPFPGRGMASLRTKGRLAAFSEHEVQAKQFRWVIWVTN